VARISGLAERKLVALVCDGQWEIDDQGRIWRHAVRVGRRSGGSHLVPIQRRRAEKRLPAGYLMVRATIDGVRVCGLAHRLVWQNSRGDILPGHEINHDNGIKDDNRPGNLLCGSSGENGSHAHRYRLLDQRGEANPAAKLKNGQVAQIRLAYDRGGYTMAQLADKFGVSFQHISRLVRGTRRQVQGGPIQNEDLRHSSSERDADTGRFIAAGDLLDGRQHHEFPA
jgi:hypothetical protein